MEMKRQESEEGGMDGERRFAKVMVFEESDKKWGYFWEIRATLGV